MMKSARLAAIGTIAALVLLGGFVLAGLDGSNGFEIRDAYAAEGDLILVHVAYFDAAGTLLYSTNPADIPEMEQNANESRQPILIPPDPQPMKFELSNLSRPTLVAGNVSILIGNDLVAKPVGYVGLYPVVGKFPGFVEPVSLEKVRGPFPHTMTVNRTVFDAMVTDRNEDRVLIDDALPGRILFEKEETVQIHLELKDGDQLPVRNTPFTAIVRPSTDETEFFLHLVINGGPHFILESPCRVGTAHVLDSGNYRLVGDSETTIELRKSPTKYPQLVDRDLVARITIHSI